MLNSPWLFQNPDFNEKKVDVETATDLLFRYIHKIKKNAEGVKKELDVFSNENATGVTNSVLFRVTGLFEIFISMGSYIAIILYWIPCSRVV